MTMEQWFKALRLAVAKEINFTFTTAPALAVPFNPLRVSLWLPAISTTTLYYGLDATFASDEGLKLYASGQFFRLDFLRDGALCFGPWFCQGLAGTFTVTAFELVLPADQQL